MQSFSFTVHMSLLAAASRISIGKKMIDVSRFMLPTPRRLLAIYFCCSKNLPKFFQGSTFKALWHWRACATYKIWRIVSHWLHIVEHNVLLGIFSSFYFIHELGVSCACLCWYTIAQFCVHNQTRLVVDLLAYLLYLDDNYASGLNTTGIC